MKYIDLSKPHAYLIWRGKQRAIVSPDILPTGEKMLITQDGKEAFGEVVLGYPAQINITEFERLEEDHATRPEERKLKWPDKESFYLYHFKDWRPFPDSRDIEINNGHAELLPFLKLTDEEQKLLERAERLPKTLVLKDEAVTLEDGQVIFCEGLDGSKVMPILEATLEDKQIKESLPLYQLALVRIPRLKLKKNMEVDMEEKAEGTKPYKVVKNHPGCKDGKPYGVLNTDTNELKGCSESESMAVNHMQALYAAENKAGPYKVVENHPDCEGAAIVNKASGEMMSCHDTMPEAMAEMATMMKKELESEDKGGVGSGRRRGGRTSSPNKKNPRASTRRSKKELAQALVDALVEEDDIVEDEVIMEEVPIEESTKCGPGMEMGEDKIPMGIVSFADLQAYETAQESEELSDKFGQLVENIMNSPTITDKPGALSKLASELSSLLAKQKSMWVGYEEAVKSKSFTEWIDDYYTFADKSAADLTEDEAVKAVWSAAFVNNLPDSSFLYIVPGCGDKDEEGKTKPRSCRMFPVKDSSGQVDLPHLRNAIARAPQASTIPEADRNKVQKKAQDMLAASKKDDGEKAGRKVKKTMIEKVRNAWQTIKEFIDWAEPEEDTEEPQMGMMSMFNGKSSVGVKKVGDKYYYVTWSTNAFQDREKEIFSTKSLEKYVSEAEQKQDRGFFNLWHIPGTDFAKKEWQGVAGRFLIEAGPFLDDEKGQAALKFFTQYADGHKDLAPEGWGCSPEYRYLPEERKSGIYENIWITRTSTLPKMAAANIWTQGGMTMALTKEQTKAAELIFGEDLTKEIVKTAEAKTKELEEAGVAHKGIEEEVKTEEVEKPVEEVKTEEPKEDDIIEKLAQVMGQKMTMDWEPLKAMLAELAENQKTLESKLTNLETEVAGEKAEETKKVKEESPKYVWRLFERASEAEKTVVAEDDPLKNKKPLEAPLQDRSGAAHFFGKR